jgi:anti-anti-sigma regulatory factor
VIADGRALLAIGAGSDDDARDHLTRRISNGRKEGAMCHYFMPPKARTAQDVDPRAPAPRRVTPTERRAPGTEADSFRLLPVYAGSGSELIVEGPVDRTTVLEFEAALLMLEHHGGDQPLTVDLSRVSFIDAAGLSAVLLARRRAGRRARQLEVIKPDGHAGRVYDIAHAQLA